MAEQLKLTGHPLFEPTPSEPAPKCCTTRDLGEQSLDCDLDNGHDGPHYDAHLRLDWSSR